ncbi:MAG: 3-isopropylmalate dehydrogenase [Spirochaetia bacterium]|jgi:3-isopropylmalate dehydrogenase|nr:3-isopropylmalate dehydrogenase [Spirochaetales bacterium]MDX9784521.1 3-isopropylmalate dehydrogenase [Spirochaetia bacterium]
MNAAIALLPGDGIGPEVTAEARKVLDAVAGRFGHHFDFRQYLIGGSALDAEGLPLPRETLTGCGECDAVLFGAVGGPRWDAVSPDKRPERGLLSLRKALGLYANLRPATLLSPLQEACPLKNSVLQASSHDGSSSFDMVIVRELTGGIYFGSRGRKDSGRSAFDTETYSYREIERLLRVAFDAAAERRGKLCVVDKANVLESSRLWREVAKNLEPEYPKVQLEFMYVDNCAMQLVRAPGQFDVIATSNLFGDILSDEASALTGSIGMLPSASLGEESIKGLGRTGLYEPIHGSAPDIAGQDKANPLGAILSAAMLLRYSLGLAEEAKVVDAAVLSVLEEGYRSDDLSTATTPDSYRVGTNQMGSLVTDQILR